MWVVKLGGSLWSSAYLPAWLQRLHEAGPDVVVVPGGGPFADSVRAAQDYWRFGDQHAHAMALLAMEQMAHMVCGLYAGGVPVDTPAETATALARAELPVWAGARAARHHPAVETGWAMTSDSLALWLARELDAEGVLLIKSAPLPAAGTAVSRLQGMGLVDGCFARYRERFDRPVRLLNRSQLAHWPAVVDDAAAALCC